MTQRLRSILPNDSDFLVLEPEELAGILLQYMNSLPEKERQQFHRSNFLQPNLVRGYPPQRYSILLQALNEAWAWLEREGFLVPRLGDSNGWVVLSRRAARFRQSSDLAAFQHANLLPRTLLHPILVAKVVAPFIRGEYDTAVFQAFKDVEVAVREASGFEATDIGVSLMRKAFDKAGPLSDKNAPEGEREALSHLFAGAIGCYKNPHSHRMVTITDPAEAVELLLLASHLLRIVDARVKELP